MSYLRQLRQVKAENDWAAAKRRAEAGEQFRAKPTVDGQNVKSDPPPVPMPASKTVN